MWVASMLWSYRISNVSAMILRLNFVISLSLLCACGGGGGSDGAGITSPGSTTPSPPDPTGLWVTSEPGEGLKIYRDKLSTISPERSLVALDAAPVATPSAEGTGGGFSTTYIVDEAVDEHDIVKYDGTVLAVAPSRSACCFILEDTPPAESVDALPPESEPQASTLRIFTTDPASGTAELQTAIQLPKEMTAEGMYLEGKRLHSLLSSGWWGTFGPRHIEPGYWESQQVELRTYDISNPSAPARVNRLEIEGGLVSSRRAGDDIYLITRHTPAIEGLIPYPATEAEALSNADILDSVGENAILPAIRLNGESITPLSLDDCYRQDPSHPLATDMPGDPMLTAILKVSASSGEVTDAACALESIDGISIGERYIALTFVRWDLSADATLLHMLSLDGLRYVGSESVSGALYSGGNADFRINEFEDVLRLVTTRWTGDPDDAFQHVLYTLTPSEDAPELITLATLGDTSDTRIGKINEDLYGVRFKGSRAYLVTFERIDPLYVLDLSDATNPRIVTELEVPGFSDLLHEVTPDLLLGLGSDTDLRPKLELFDISNLNEPASRSYIPLAPGWDWAYSPAQYNRYALTYLAGEERDRLTVPYSAQRWTDERYEQIDRIALFEISNKSDASTAAIEPVGEVTLLPGTVSGDTRVVLDGAALYVIAHTDLLGGLWSNPEAMQLIGE